MNDFQLTEEGKTHADCETDLNENYSALSFLGEIYLKPVWQALLGEGKGNWTRARIAGAAPLAPLFIAPDTQAF